MDDSTKPGLTRHPFEVAARHLRDTFHWSVLPVRNTQEGSGWKKAPACTWKKYQRRLPRLVFRTYLQSVSAFRTRTKRLFTRWDAA